MESGLNDHRGQTEHIGLALISGCWRIFPRDRGAPGKQLGFGVTGIHGLRLRSQQTIAIFDAVTVPRNLQRFALEDTTVGRRRWRGFPNLRASLALDQN
jgi:hypothetical protein